MNIRKREIGLQMSANNRNLPYWYDRKHEVMWSHLHQVNSEQALRRLTATEETIMPDRAEESKRVVVNDEDITPFIDDPEHDPNHNEYLAEYIDDRKNTMKSRKLEKVVIDVGGKIFRTMRGTMVKHADTRLAELAKSKFRRFFFDRNPAVFRYILEYYRTGALHLPSICPTVVKEELKFWNISERKACTRCLEQMYEYENQMLGYEEIEKDFTWRTDIEIPEKYSKKWYTKAFKFLDDATYSPAAMIYALFFLLCVFISLVTFIARTVDTFLEPKPHEVNLTKVFNDEPTLLGNMKAERIMTMQLRPFFYYIDNIVMGVFALDIIARLLLCPMKIRFLLTPLTMIDIICTAPMTVTVVLRYSFQSLLDHNLNMNIAYAFLDATKVLRAAHILKLTEKYSPLRILVISIRKSMREIIFLIIFMLIFMVLFATVIFYVEFWESESHFKDIPSGFWWGIVTMTTVGYGDMYPQSLFGYIIGSLCMVVGIVVVALPIPIVGNNFAMLWEYAMEQTRKKKGEEKRKKDKVMGDVLANFSFGKFAQIAKKAKKKDANHKQKTIEGRKGRQDVSTVERTPATNGPVRSPDDNKRRDEYSLFQRERNDMLF